jgi:hypothetical protein
MENKGFFGGLFDLTFTEFVTIRVIKVLFVLAIIISGVFAVGILIAGFAGGAARGLLALIGAPIVFLLYVLGARIWLEVIIVLFRIAENTGKLVEMGQSKNQPPTEQQ